MVRLFDMNDRDIELFIKDFLKEIREDNAAIFAGAGLSASAGFVNWRELLRPIADELRLDVDKCKVPDDCIDPRRRPLFMARATMRALIADVRATKKESISCSSHCTKMHALPPAIRAEIAASNESTRALAKRFGVSELTIAKWRKRVSVNDLPHTPHRLQTTLSTAQEVIVVELRKSLLLPLDDLVAVTKEFICPKASRSGLDRSLRRHGLSNLHKLKPIQPKSPHKPFNSYVPGYLHVDIKYLPQMADETARSYLLVVRVCLRVSMHSINSVPNWA